MKPEDSNMTGVLMGDRDTPGMWVRRGKATCRRRERAATDRPGTGAWEETKPEDTYVSGFSGQSGEKTNV